MCASLSLLDAHTRTSLYFSACVAHVCTCLYADDHTLSACFRNLKVLLAVGSNVAVFAVDVYRERPPSALLVLLVSAAGVGGLLLVSHYALRRRRKGTSRAEPEGGFAMTRLAVIDGILQRRCGSEWRFHKAYRTFIMCERCYQASYAQLCAAKNSSKILGPKEDASLRAPLYIEQLMILLLSGVISAAEH
ncbi:unnamed protein product [Rangifer tarandus platyrhynchus]|uniref:Uncharacterized protein n=1 Tax=Rangifer tarandus platyrhynchus TaxID=3082113 RepID=A0ABN8XJU1_RANTA|nr:unnamed protein product [Rangifer tarandus platyrhynchus]